jgi:hypothetical protein
MKIAVKENRKLVVVNSQSTQNENDVERIELTVPTKYENFIKRIVFITNNAVVSRLFTNNVYIIENDISQYEYLEYYIWLVNDEQDFRSEIKTLILNPTRNLTGSVTPAEKSEMEQVIDTLDEEILKVTALENEIQTKLDNGDFDGEDGTDGKDGTDGFSPILNETKTQNGYDISITDANGTKVISLLNGENGKDGINGVDGFSPILTETQIQNGYNITITDANGTRTIILLNGKDGTNGATGATGNGIVSIAKTGTSGLIDTYTITFTNGNTTTFTVTNGQNGQNGQDGYTPVKGTDYFTPQEIQDIEDDILEDIDVKPQVFYWDGAIDQTGLDFWNNIYQIQKTTPVIVSHTKRMGAYYITFNWKYNNNMPTSAFETTESNIYSRVVGSNSLSSGFNNLALYEFYVYFTIVNDTVTNISRGYQTQYIAYLSATENYSQPYTPLYNGSPATKKYVDDSITNAITNAISASY